MKLKNFNNLKNLSLNFPTKSKSNLTLKNLCNLVYQYHIRKKRIWFTNMPPAVASVFKKSNEKKRHTFFVSNFWIKGLISNKFTCLYSILKKQKKIKFLLSLKKKNNLVVDSSSCDFINHHSFIEKECNDAKIPFINLKENFFDSSLTNKPIDFQNNYLKPFFFPFLKSILKKKPSLKKNSYVFSRKFFVEKFNKHKKYSKKKFNTPFRKKNAFFKK